MKYFTPKSPDPFIKKDADMSIAKFGHLNAIVNELNQFHLNQTIAAFAGGGQISGTSLITGINVVNTATNGDSVVLPCIGTCNSLSCRCCVNNDVAAETTAPVVIKNNGPGTLTVYPCPGVAIDGLPVNTPIIVGIGSSISVTRLSCSDWATYGCCVVINNDIISVTGCNVTEPTPGNIVIGNTVVDGVTITGTGCIGNPLIAVIPAATLPCIVTPAPSYTPVLPELSVLTGTGAPLACLDVCIDGITITKNVNGCLQAIPAGPSSLPYGMFYGLTAGTGNGGPTNYAATVAPGAAVPFPQNGPAAGIVRSGPGIFTLAAIGTYEINFKVHTTEPGQLQLRVNGVAVAYTTTPSMNPTAGGHNMVGTGIFITTTVINETIEVINPAGNSPALTITSADGASTHANAQSITIKKIA